MSSNPPYGPDDASNQGLGDSAGYSSGPDQGAAGYGTGPGQNAPGYGTGPGQGAPSYGTSPGQNAPGYGTGPTYGGQPGYGNQAGYGGGAGYGGPSGGSDERPMAVVAHLSPLIAMVLSAGWLSFLGPLIVWFIYKDRSPLVRNAAATAFNFNITVWLAVVVGWILLITLVGIPLAILLWIVAAVAQIVLSIVGAVRASRGERYTYPLQVPILT